MNRFFATLALLSGALLALGQKQNPQERYAYQKVTIDNKSENHLISDSLSFIWGIPQKLDAKTRETVIIEKKSGDRFRWVSEDGKPDLLFYDDQLLAQVSSRGITQITIGERIYDVERGSNEWSFTRYRKPIMSGYILKRGSEKSIGLNVNDPEDPNLEILRILTLQYGYKKVDGKSQAGLIVGVVVGVTVLRIALSAALQSADPQ
jgi:hypothetical protein